MQWLPKGDMTPIPLRPREQVCGRRIGEGARHTCDSQPQVLKRSRPYLGGFRTTRELHGFSRGLREPTTCGYANYPGTEKAKRFPAIRRTTCLVRPFRLARFGLLSPLRLVRRYVAWAVVVAADAEGPDSRLGGHSPSRFVEAFALLLAGVAQHGVEGPLELRAGGVR